MSPTIHCLLRRKLSPLLLDYYKEQRCSPHPYTLSLGPSHLYDVPGALEDRSRHTDLLPLVTPPDPNQYPHKMAFSPEPLSHDSNGVELHVKIASQQYIIHVGV